MCRIVFLTFSTGFLLLVSACTQPITAGTVGKLKAQLPVEAMITFE